MNYSFFQLVAMNIHNTSHTVGYDALRFMPNYDQLYNFLCHSIKSTLFSDQNVNKINNNQSLTQLTVNKMK